MVQCDMNTAARGKVTMKELDGATLANTLMPRFMEKKVEDAQR